MTNSTQLKLNFKFKGEGGTLHRIIKDIESRRLKEPKNVVHMKSIKLKHLL
jgi:hypothetical protein